MVGILFFGILGLVFVMDIYWLLLVVCLIMIWIFLLIGVNFIVLDRRFSIICCSVCLLVYILGRLVLREWCRVMVFVLEWIFIMLKYLVMMLFRNRVFF